MLHAVLLRPIDFGLKHADVRALVERGNSALLYCGLLDYQLRLFPDREELAGHPRSGTSMHCKHYEHFKQSLRDTDLN